MGREWRRNGILVLVCTALFWVDVPYRASFFDIPAQGSLAHLHAGWLFAVAVLYRDRATLAACVAAAFASWAVRVALFEGGGTPVVYLGGALSYALTYVGLRAAVRWLVPPSRQPFLFGARDLPGFALVGMFAYPLALALYAGLYLLPSAGLVVAANSAMQVVFAKLFGVLIVSLPVIVLATHGTREDDIGKPPRVPWMILIVGIGVPALGLRFAPVDSRIVDAVLTTFADYRLLVTALLVLAAKRRSLRFSMTALVLAEFLFAASLARHTGPTTLLDAAVLLRFAVECLIALWLVLALLLYGRERDDAAERHRQASLRDPLSDLPNLSALRRHSATGALPPLGFLLLDRSESIFAGLGLRAQATLSRWIANLLRDVGETYDIGTGHLVILLRGEPTGEAAAVAWDSVLRRLHGGEFLWRERPVRVLPYLGVAGNDIPGECFEERMARASDAAMEARDRGESRALHALPNNARASLSTHGRSLQVSTNALARIRAGEIELYCQPLLAVSEHAAGSGTHGEILCRLHDEVGRLLLPDEFMRELEADRRMAELDLAVVRSLDRWLRRHENARGPIARLSVNLASQSLASLSFARELLALVDEFALPPGMLCFEVTETAAITHAGDAVALLDALRERGCHIAIDDFGVGYQSFERLKQIPANVLKIDGSFVRDLARNPRDHATVRAVVAIARAYGAETVAEWVEDEATLVLLRELGVDWAQGFHLARPMPIERVLLATPSAAVSGGWD